MKQIKLSNISSDSYTHEHFMKKAIAIANTTLGLGNFPVGCVIEYRGNIIASGSRIGTNNNEKNNEIDHAEINALKKLALYDREHGRSLMTLYCNLEPCLMCFGAMLLSGISNIVFAYEDIMGGGTNCNILELPSLYSDLALNITSGVLRNRSLNLFKLFFSDSKNDYLKNSKLCLYTMNQ